MTITAVIVAVALTVVNNKDSNDDDICIIHDKMYYSILTWQYNLKTKNILFSETHQSD